MAWIKEFIEWRNNKLKETDWIVAVPDHPLLAEYKIFRQELRDWPAATRDIIMLDLEGNPTGEIFKEPLFPFDRPVEPPKE